MSVTAYGMNKLVDELMRQWRLASTPEGGSKTNKLWNSGVVSLQNQPKDFCDAVYSLCLQIQEATSNHSDTGNIMLSDTSLLWKISAFCLPVPYFFEPAQMVHRLNALREVRIMRDPSKRNTLGFWLHKGLDSWIAPQEQKLLIIQVGYNMTHQMEHFSLEMTIFLSARKPTVFLLSSFANPESRMVFGDMHPEQVLQHLSIQALQKASVPQTASFLAYILERFRTANSCNDWVKIMTLISTYSTKFYVVLDLGIVQIQHAELLRSALRTLLRETQSRNDCDWKIMLMSSRKLEPTVDLMEIVISPTENARLPIRTNLSSVQKSLLSKFGSLEKTEAANFKTLGAMSETLIMTKPGSRRLTFDIAQTIAVSTSNLPAFPELDNHLNEAESSQQTKEEAYNPTCIRQNCVCCRKNDTKAIQRPHTSSLEADHRNTQEPKTLPIRTDGRHHKVTIAIFCALPLESDAVEGQLNEYFQTDLLPTQKVASDINTYSRGRIGYHHVVIVHLAGMGKSNAAVSAANCKASFPDIKLALVVGICGGVPSYIDEIERCIVLGDIVVSEGLIPFDFGRQYPDKFAMKDDLVDTLGKPPPAIRSLVNKLKGQSGRKHLAGRTHQYLEDTSHDLRLYAVYPGVDEDKLYEETYRHKHHSLLSCRICTDEKDLVCEAARSSSCETLSCSNDRLVRRSRLNQQGSCGPAIHFGLMASGDQVMKSGEHRNNIAKRHNVIAFEMEGAGVWEIFPCMVIKGVCDYADSHKNKKWQRYAAATAAACMKALLDEWTLTS